MEHSYIRMARNYHNHANISSKAIYLALWQTQEQQWRAAIFPQKIFGKKGNKIGYIKFDVSVSFFRRYYAIYVVHSG